MKLKKFLSEVLTLTILLLSTNSATVSATNQEPLQVQDSGQELSEEYATEVVEHYWDFEPLADVTQGNPLDGFTIGSTGGNISLAEQEEEKNHTSHGQSSMKITGTTSEAKYEVKSEYLGIQRGKKFSLWIYDDLDPMKNICLLLDGNPSDSSNSNRLYFGISNTNGYRAYAGTKTEYVKGFDVRKPRTIKGWHEFTIDMQMPGEVKFYLDDELFGILALDKEEYGAFSQFSIINFWKNESLPLDLNCYVDDISISVAAPVPSSPIVDDLSNTFDWSNAMGKSDVADYEYTLDGGATWHDCLEKPIVIGNKEYAAGSVGVRCKALKGSGDTYKAIYNAEAYTVSVNVQLFMEHYSDIETFQKISKTKPALSLSESHSRSGLTCMKLTPDSNNSEPNKYEIGLKYPELVSNKVVTLWYYDEMNSSSSYNAFAFVSAGDPATSKNQYFLGVMNSFSKTNYVFRPFGSNWQKTSVTRSQGWHCFQWDYTLEGSCSFYIDSIKVAETQENIGFDRLVLINAWTTNHYVRYYDDLSVTDSREDVPVIPSAPTNPVEDDKNDTFGWTYVSGKEEPELYEISIDNGNTFKECSHNPQSIQEGMIPEGQVMVRLKATEESLAGSVLRSKFPYSNSDTLAKNMLLKQIEFCSYANKNDYTEESWNALLDAIDKAKQFIEEDLKYSEGLELISSARANLVLKIDNNKTYNFKDHVVPVEPACGIVDWDKDANFSFLTEQAYKINTDANNNRARLFYTFPSALKNKQITFYMFDNLKGKGQFEFRFGDSTTENGYVISSMELDGASARTYRFYDLVKNEMTNRRDLTMRRRQDLHKIEINMTNNLGTQIYMDGILVFSNTNLNQLDYLDLNVFGNNNGTPTYLWIDELNIREKNPVTKITLPKDEVDLGYYDTYEINVVNYQLDTRYDYPTTDKFSYSIDNPEVARITKNGSIQPIALTGNTKATVMATNGASASINVNIKDYKVEEIHISDSPASLAPHIIDSLEMNPGEIKVVNAVIVPEGATNRKKEWTSSSEDVVTVHDGKIVAKAEGTATITVSAENGKVQNKIKVNVVKEDMNFGMELFVAQDGNDYRGDGTIEKPFQTIQRARDEIRSLCETVRGGVCVYFREGNYVISDTINFDERDSGNVDNLVKYMAYGTEKVTFDGSLSLKASQFKPIADMEVINKLPDGVEKKVYEIDLSSYISDMLKLTGKGYGGVGNPVYEWLTKDGYNLSLPYYTVSFNGKLMTLSRWPNVEQPVSGCSFPGYAKVEKINYNGQILRYWNIDQKGTGNYIEPEDRNPYDAYAFTSNQLSQRMKTWKGVNRDGTDILDQNIWYEGFTSADYVPQTSPIRSITEEGKIQSHFACIYQPRIAHYSRVYVYNLIQELDAPGEWYLDKNTKKLYIIPPEGINMTDDTNSVSISILGENMFELNNTKSITMEGFNIQNTLGGVYIIRGGNHNKLSRCTITNISNRVGSIADSTTERATNNGIEYCEIKDVNGGFSITGSSDYTKLTPGFNYVHGCSFDNYQMFTSGFNPAIGLYGVGNTASCNEIKNSQNNAIMWKGNDNVIEFNNIHDVDLQTTDTSAIYTGRNRLTRGTVIKNNWIHNLGKTASNASANSAIYLDDTASGMRIYDNILEDARWGVFVNGGQDNIIINNTFKNCKYGVVANDWGYTGLLSRYSHGNGLYKNPDDQSPAPEWKVPGGPYSKYPYLYTSFEDKYFDSIYNKVIDNDYTGTPQLFDYMLREVQPDAKNTIIDWYFTKGNTTNY